MVKLIRILRVARNIDVLPIRLFSSTSALSVSPKITKMTTDEVGKMVNVEWEDGKQGTFPYVWLKDTSPDPQTYHIEPAMKARKLLMTDFDPEVVPKRTSLASDGNAVEISWPDGTESCFKSDWLRYRNPSDEEQRELRRKVYCDQYQTWGREEIEARMIKYDYKEVMNNDKPLHDWLSDVCRDGIGLIENAPATEGVIEKLGDRIGMIQRSHMGKIFSVVVKPEASNMAYSNSKELPLHTDFPALVENPNMQMLHMIEKAPKGGESTFADGFRVSEQLRDEKPEEFRMLSTISLEYIEEGYDKNDESERFDYDNMARHKIINMNEDGKFTKTWFGNAMRSWFYDIPPEQILPMYRAMKTYVTYAYQDRNFLKLAMEPGDVVLWGNDRLMHARIAFEGPRKLEGCYYTWDIVRSKVRHLRDKLQLPENQPSI